MAARISITEFMKTEDAAGGAPAKNNKSAFEVDGPEAVYFILDDTRVMFLSNRRYMSQ
jgi:hypothetical protein